MQILVGYNGSDASTAALYELRHAGLPDKSEILLLTVAESWLQPKTVAEAEKVSITGKKILANEFPDSAITALTATGSPPREILAHAESFSPDLIVVGEPGGKAEHSLFLGHTSNVVLNEARWSVRIARSTGGSTTRSPRLLVGFDGSVGAVNAVDSIVSRQWGAGTEVRLLVVGDTSMLSSIGRFTPDIASAAIQPRFTLQWAESLAAASLEKLAKADIPATVAMRVGHAKDVILHEAQEYRPHTIFVGPHCLPNSFERFLIGSVSSAVAARATCSVEVIRKA